MNCILITVFKMSILNHLFCLQTFGQTLIYITNMLYLLLKSEFRINSNSYTYQ